MSKSSLSPLCPRINFQLYGYQDELDLFEQFIKALEEASIPKTVETINKLIN